MIDLECSFDILHVSNFKFMTLAENLVCKLTNDFKTKKRIRDMLTNEIVFKI